MNLTYITLSGVNEKVQVADMLRFMLMQGMDLAPRFNPLEFAVQVDGSNASLGMARYWWLKSLYYYVKYQPYKLNLALHINKDWAAEFYQGILVPELTDFLSLRVSATNDNFCGRVQVNFPDKYFAGFDAEKVLELCSCYQCVKFIFQYNEKSARLIKEMSRYDKSFALLKDASCGKGLLPDNWKIPELSEVNWGFAGGLAANNIADNLKKIVATLPPNKDFWIDAESSLKDEQGDFSLEKCEKFLEAIRQNYQYSI